MTQLTVKEALEQGYTYCCPYMDEGCYRIDKIVLSKNIKYVLATKEPTPYTIPDTLVFELVDEYLLNQDEVFDDDGKMSGLIAGKVDFSTITR